jgi:hypothetical protein
MAAPGQGWPGPGALGQALPHGAATDAYQYSAASRHRKGRWSRTVAGIGLVAVAATIGALVVTTQPQALSPVAFVRQSAQQTLAQHTADMTVSMNLQFGGQSMTIHGTGELNFSTDAMAIDLSGGVAGQSVDLKEILVNGTLYMSFGVNGSNPFGSGDSTWSQTPVPKSGAQSYDDGDPYTMLSALQQAGIALRPLGTRVVGGVTCTGYAVTPPATDKGLHVTITVWADSQRLVREVSEGIQMDVSGSHAQASVTMDFSNFGAPVHITPPPAAPSAA